MGTAGRNAAGGNGSSNISSDDLSVRSNKSMAGRNAAGGSGSGSGNISRWDKGQTSTFFEEGEGFVLPENLTMKRNPRRAESYDETAFRFARQEEARINLTANARRKVSRSRSSNLVAPRRTNSGDSTAS